MCQSQGKPLRANVRVNSCPPDYARVQVRQSTGASVCANVTFWGNPCTHVCNPDPQTIVQPYVTLDERERGSYYLSNEFLGQNLLMTPLLTAVPRIVPPHTLTWFRNIISIVTVRLLIQHKPQTHHDHVTNSN